MLRFSFKRGLKFFRGQVAWELSRRLPDGRLQLESHEGELWTTSETEIMSLLAKGRLTVDLATNSTSEPARPVVSRDLASYHEAAQAEAKYRMAYVSALLDRGIGQTSGVVARQAIAEVANGLGDHKPPAPITVYRWVRAFQRGGSILCLLSRKERRGRRRRWAPEVITAMDDVLDKVFLDQQRRPRTEVIRELRYQLDRAGQGHLVPSKASIYRYLQEIEAYDVVEAREGKAAAQRKFRAVVGTQRAAEILERVEIDHTPLNIIVFCEEAKRGNGRPWLTVAIDKHSRLIVGYYISFRAPSAYSVLQCLRQMILPKDELLANYPDITTPWPARGIPIYIVCDNGMDLHAYAFSYACLELGISTMFCPAKEPQYKGSVERFLKTINHDLIHQLPGTVFSNPKERGDYAAEKLSCITFRTLHHQILKWIVEIYNVTPHRGLKGATPLETWRQGEKRVILQYPSEPAQVDVIIGMPANRRVFHYGVEVNSLYYNNEDLQCLRRRHGEALHVDLKFYEDDVGFVHVFDPDRKVYFAVPAIDQAYAAGTSLHMHMLIKEKSRHTNNDPGLQLALIEKKKEINDLTTQAVADKKMATRKKAAVLRGINTSVSAIAGKVKAEAVPLPLTDSVRRAPKLRVRLRADRVVVEDDHG